MSDKNKEKENKWTESARVKHEEGRGPLQHLTEGLTIPGFPRCWNCGKRLFGTYYLNDNRPACERHK